MLELDIRTIHLVSFATNLATAWFIWSQRRSPIPSAARAARLWSVGFLCVSLGSLGMALRSVVPDGISILFGDSFIVGGFAIAIIGLRAFFERRAMYWPAAAVTSCLVLSAAYWWFVSPDERMRIVAMCAAGSALCLWLVVTLRPWHTAGAGGIRGGLQASIVAGVFGIAVAIIAVRWMLRPPEEVNLFSSGAVAATVSALIVVSMFFALWTLSLLTGRMSASLRREVRRRDRLISVLAHDLRTPFNLLLGGTEAMELYARMGDHNKVLETAGEVHRASHQANTLVESLLTWGRSQLVGAELRPVNLSDAFGRVHHSMKSSIERKSLRCAPPDRSDVAALGDAASVEIVIRNILANAIKFSEPGGEIRIGIGRKGAMAELSIGDDGVGMDADTLEQVRRPGAQETVAGTLGETGTGLGLSFCHDLVDAQGGRLIIESLKGRGTDVTICLPLEQV
ncbi:MAG: sensor histidine kinase [Minwuia sp.]|uniref:sensor histidine kinase n=1 Tax=Minwuia sp. TaxID=2493630 RepID=UPI003A87CD9F